MATRDIIVIGGSSGATAPLKSLLHGLRSDLPASVFIVMHVPPRGTGILKTVAEAAGPLPVREAEHGMKIERTCVYIASPNTHMILTDGIIRLGRGPRENMVRPAVDPLFRSAAVTYGPRVVGVILSGLLNDGAAGIEAVKLCGGLAVVQDPADAIANEMPLAAIGAVTVDLIVPGASMGDVLSDLASEAAGPTLPIPPELWLEVSIAAGDRIGKEGLRKVATPVAITCPSCGGVMSKMENGKPLRFRCQVGHAYTADMLAKEQEGQVDEALRVALRIIEERAELVHRMADEGRRTGRRAVAEMYDERADEYRAYAEKIRDVVIRSLDRPKDDA